MQDLAATFINEEFFSDKVSGLQMDILLAEGWRHFGSHFYRYNLGIYEDQIRIVQPLRIRLTDFAPSKSQRRILRRNAGLRVEIRPITIEPATETLFERHKQRFAHSVPESIYDFISETPASLPCEAGELRVLDGEKLLAASFFDVAANALSGIYAMFEPEEQHRGLGIFTMLKEIEHARDSGKQYYYPGYCYEGESFYDYKKRFRAMETFDWNEKWFPFREGDSIL